MSSKILLAVAILWSQHGASQAFVSDNARLTRPTFGYAVASKHVRHAKPKRLSENAEGVVYVNDKCINCAACSAFAPDTFGRPKSAPYHIVTRQPDTHEEILQARAALAACPVAAIRVETLAERRHRAKDKQKVEEEWTDHDEELVRLMGLSERSGLEKPFPRPFLTPHEPVPNVFWTGHHNDASFGATPYLLRTTIQDRIVWVMIDTPRFSSSAIQAVTTLTGPDGPDYLFLTHVDDTADHSKWAQEFPSLKRIFHSGDLGRHNWLGDKSLEQVEILLQNQPTTSAKGTLTAYSLNGEVLPDDWLTSTTTESHPVVILHTPGHSPGSITLYKRPIGSEPGILFTGDTYAYTTRDGGHMSAFPRYGNNLRQQSDTIDHYLKLDWDVIAPGHGHPRDYRGIKDKNLLQATEMVAAKEELHASVKWY